MINKLKCSWKYFIPKKFKTIEPFKLHFFRSIPFCKYRILLASVKLLETFLETILSKRIQISLRILNDISSITKPVHSMLISVEATGKCQLDSDQYYGALLQCRYFVLYEQILNQNRTVCWSILVMDKPYSCSLLFGVIPSDRIHNSTKEINVPNFPSFSKFCKLYQRIPGMF